MTPPRMNGLIVVQKSGFHLVDVFAILFLHAALFLHIAHLFGQLRFGFAFRLAGALFFMLGVFLFKP